MRGRVEGVEGTIVGTIKATATATITDKSTVVIRQV